MFWMQKNVARTMIFLSIALAVGAFWFMPVRQTEAAINPQINFQGKLTNPDGTNVADGSYSIMFSLYSVASGGTAVWSETQTGVSVSSGVFQVSLGSITALPGGVNFASSPLYLGVKVGSDAEMTPRIQFTAAPYAFNASNADNLGGIAAGSYVQLSPGSTQTGYINISGDITAAGNYNGNTFTGSKLQFSSAMASLLQGANSQAFTVDSGTSGSLALGSSNASGITLGRFGTTTTTAGALSINSSTNVPTTDQVVIDNTASTGVTTAGVNGLNIKYKGGAAAVEASGLRVDYTPGATSGGVWSGMRIVESTAAASGVSSYGLKLEGAGVGAGDSYGIEVATGWDIGIDIQSGGLQLAAQEDPAAPAAGNLRVYAKDIAGRVMPKWIGPAGVDTPMQASFGFNRIAMATPSGLTAAAATTMFNTWGGNVTNSASTYTNPALATTDFKAAVRRARLTTTATSGNVAYSRPASTMTWRGNAAGLGGFFFTTRFGLGATAANNRAYVGLTDSIANPTNVDPTTNNGYGKIGVAINTNTGNWNFITNASGTAPTVTALGANFPVNTTDLYELALFSAPNGSTIGWRVKNLGTGNQTSGSVSANMPNNTTFLAPVWWMSTNVNTAVAIENAGWYLESDN